MGRMPGHAQAARIEQLSEKIEHWRKTRKRRTRMPEELWRAAVALAREHGVYATARDLRVRYESLRARLDGTPRERGTESGARAFVDLGAAIGATEDNRTVVELVGASGAKLTIRLG